MFRNQPLRLSALCPCSGSNTSKMHTGRQLLQPQNMYHSILGKLQVMHIVNEAANAPATCHAELCEKTELKHEIKTRPNSSAHLQRLTIMSCLVVYRYYKTLLPIITLAGTPKEALPCSAVALATCLLGICNTKHPGRTHNTTLNTTLHRVSTYGTLSAGPRPPARRRHSSQSQSPPRTQTENILGVE